MMVNLIDELKNAYNGDAWHGNNTLNLLAAVDPQKAFEHHIPNAHSIAELVLHMTAWTEEVTERILGSAAKEPTRGDWPTPQEKTVTAWGLIVNDFKTANEKLLAELETLDSSDWSTIVQDDRDLAVRNTKTNYAQLINGLLQHHAYHSGQVALLSKF